MSGMKSLRTIKAFVNNFIKFFNFTFCKFDSIFYPCTFFAKANKLNVILHLTLMYNSTSVFYNLYRGHGSLRKELKVKTPIDAVKKWFELKSELFKIKPEVLHKKINKFSKTK